ncbi:MAG: hypothetical protein HN778_11020 [Prolixibacteraceae bacterium]|jgi:hypothetical protein|nr:hypothetical protein [Prolixibacteraceae bacterium]MBT6005329.1 hypothetical protein [Prolixibacteraceae bacterium]MBT6766738.1 hypothetical protein [Prolixibacteraceae bacterium]MBT6999569.1 hypothetical protein [Prolixibacteraceae bacterium]MBT7395353.1 hypothetical protein [Prolixibacteraceae bacterium]
MKKKLNEISGYFKLEKLKNDKRIVVFIVCLSIATVLWFLNALSKDYSTTISYPVKYVNPPGNQFLSNSPPAKFDLKVEAHGFTLLRHKLNLSFSPIVLNLSSTTQNLSGENGSFSIRTESLRRRISDQVSSEIRIIEVMPDFVILVLDSLITKTVPVEVNIKTGFKPQFFLKEPISISPEKAQITGPANILDTIFSLKTEVKNYNKLDSDIEKTVEIVHPDKTSVLPEKVTLKIPVEKFTEKKLNVFIEVINKPDGTKIKLFPSEITVTFLVGLSEFENITANDFKLFVDYNSITNDGKNLKIDVDSEPENIQMVRILPETVEYLIETN